MSTRLWTCTRSAAWQWCRATWYWRIDHLRTTFTSQLIKTHLPTWWTFAAVTGLLAFMTSTCQLVYAKINNHRISTQPSTTMTHTVDMSLKLISSSSITDTHIHTPRHPYGFRHQLKTFLYKLAFDPL